jgi:CDP-diacylglycerol--serine O-phosphatidyltransferase
MQIKAAIPNLLTLGNLACGTAGLFLLATHGVAGVDPWTIAWLMIAAQVCDFLDGGVARLLKVSSPMGKELDSLADMVTFGVFPGFLAYQVLRMILIPVGSVDPGWHVTVVPWWIAALPYLAMLIPLFSALRLAKFNIDTRQSDSFIGVPTPANALLWLSLYMTAAMTIGVGAPQDGIWVWVMSPWVMLAMVVASSVLLVSPFRLIAFKFKNFGLRDNLMRYVMLLGSGVLVALFTYKSVPLIFILYFTVSLIDTHILKQK